MDSDDISRVKIHQKTLCICKLNGVILSILNTDSVSRVKSV